MARILLSAIFSAIVASALAAPTIPSDIAAHATSLAKSVIALTESAKHNPDTEKFDAVMQDLVKKYIDFEQIIAKTYVELTGNKEDSETAFKSYYEAVDKLWHSALGDKEGKDVTVVELAAAAKHIAQQMVNLIPQLQMTPEHLDQLLAHGEVMFIIADDSHHIIHPFVPADEHDDEEDEDDHREKRHADIFWATRGHHGHHGHHHGHHGNHWGHHGHHGHHGGHWGHHGHHGHHARHNNIFWAVGKQRHHDAHGIHAQHHHAHHPHHHNNIFWAGRR